MTLLAFAVVKIVSGPDPGALMARLHLHWPVAILEIGPGVAFFSKRWSLAAWSGACLFAAGLAVGVFFGDFSCGCCGRALRLSTAVHTMIASAGGLLCAVLLLWQPRRLCEAPMVG